MQLFIPSASDVNDKMKRRKNPFNYKPIEFIFSLCSLFMEARVLDDLKQAANEFG
jgi:hypothetical protein